MLNNRIARIIGTSTVAGLSAATLLALAASPAAASAAVPVAGSIVATDVTSEATAKAIAVIGIDANTPKGLTISGHGGKPIVVSSAGTASRKIQPPSTKPIAVRNLVAGKTYNVAVDGRTVGKATPLVAPAATSKLTVTTTDTAGAVALSWNHVPVKGQGSVEFVVTATPVGVIAARASVVPAVVTSTSKTAVLDSLDTDTLYEFRVAARNTAATGKASTATMTKTLAELAPSTSTPVTPPAPQPKPATPAAPTTPSTPSAPATRIELFCVDGYTLTGSDCVKTLAYTLRTESTPYTFHVETTPYTYTWTAVGSHTVQHPPTHCDYLPNPNSPTGLDIYCYGQWTETITDYANVKDPTPTDWTDNGVAWTRQVKDTAPTGWTDNGAAWTRQVKDTTPAGFEDNGTAWVKTIPASSRQVPA